MINHVHWIVRPESQTALVRLFGYVQGKYDATGTVCGASQATLGRRASPPARFMGRICGAVA
jgi:hypothetical protein